MGFLKKDVNKSLVNMIIVFLIIFIAFTIYYETSLRDVLSKKNENDHKINEMTAKLIIEKFNGTNRLSEIAQVDKAMLEERYNDLSIQNEKLKKEKKSLEEEVTLLKSELEYQKVRLEGPVAQFRLIQNKNLEIKHLQDKIDELCSRIYYSNVSEKECR